MSYRENAVVRQIWVAVARTTVLWRVNTGMGWVSGGGQIRRLTDGSVVIPCARPIALGLAKPDGKPVAGTLDLIGYTRVTVTPEMVGMTLPVLTVIDGKEPGGGRTSKDQAHMIDVVSREGGVAGIAPSAAVAQAIIRDWFARVGTK